MATNFKRMDEIKSVIRTYRITQSIKATARMMCVSKNTVRKYIRRLNKKGMPLSEVESKSDEELSKLFYSIDEAYENNRQEVFAQKASYWVKELGKVGVTRRLLWEEYREEYSEGFSYSQFCDRLSRYIKRKDLTLAMNHPPGEKLMLDFAGKTVPWYNRRSGEEYRAQVLIGVLPHTHYTYVIALPDQKTSTFLYGLNKTLEYLGGVPQYLLSDNLKAYVTTADRYEPDYNELTVQLANHYGIDLQATRVSKPKDKGSVENMVSTVYTRLYAPLRNAVFYSIDEINEAFSRRLEIHNREPYQKREGNRKEYFKKYEKPLLKDLPSEPFELKKQTRAKIQNNYHAFLGEEKNYYSVPHQYVGQYVQMVYTTKIVEIYLKGKRIAIHNRLGKEQQYQYSTQENHKPEAHRIYEEIRQYNDTDFMKQASAIGEYTHWAIDHILTYQPNKDQSYKSCLGILRLGEFYGYDRLEKACRKCQHTNQVNYKMLKRILAKNLENVPNQTATCPKIEHDNIRGSQTYF